MGESVAEPAFRQAVRNASIDLTYTTQDVVVDPTFAAAIGVADLAKRGMENPGGVRGPCLEPFRCTELRDSVNRGFRSEL